MKTTKFTHLKLMSVIESAYIEQALECLATAGFKPVETALQADDVRLVYRDILLAENDVGKDHLARERKAIEDILANHQVVGRWLASNIQEQDIFFIPENELEYNGRTVCVEIYPKLVGYVE